jgi:hypothetical protein
MKIWIKFHILYSAFQFATGSISDKVKW